MSRDILIWCWRLYLAACFIFTFVSFFSLGSPLGAVDVLWLNLNPAVGLDTKHLVTRDGIFFYYTNVHRAVYVALCIFFGVGLLIAIPITWVIGIILKLLVGIVSLLVVVAAYSIGAAILVAGVMLGIFVFLVFRFLEQIVHLFAWVSYGIDIVLWRRGRKASRELSSPTGATVMSDDSEPDKGIRGVPATRISTNPMQLISSVRQRIAARIDAKTYGLQRQMVRSHNELTQELLASHDLHTEVQNAGMKRVEKTAKQEGTMIQAQEELEDLKAQREKNKARRASDPATHLFETEFKPTFHYAPKADNFKRAARLQADLETAALLEKSLQQVENGPYSEPQKKMFRERINKELKDLAEGVRRYDDDAEKV